MEGIHSIGVTKKGIECNYDPNVINMETIVNALSLQGVKVGL
ncbi:hypothetical protein LCGC14_1937560 [marine sediment metagenome]|uniref:Uncharacterized protein n=1 Tax=marine sediment metagenome TaxID=412755 RepID=A0A0F9G9Q8_9ZZZZ